MPKPLIIAHRGSSAVAPENTLAAFKQAIRDGADGIEFDVRLARDGVPVVIHDATLQRTGGLKKRVSSLTSSELSAIDVGSWFNRRHPHLANAEYSAEYVPTLEKTLEILNDFKGLIYIELKCKTDLEADRLVDAVGEVISSSPLLPQIIVQSFNLSALPRIRRLVQEIKTAALFAPKVKRFLKQEKSLVKLARRFEADHLSLHYLLVNSRLVRNASLAGMTVTAWTVNKANWLRRAERIGAYAVISNNPATFIIARAEINR